MIQNTQNKNINQTKMMELQELIETDGLKQGLLPHHFCEVTTDQHG